MQGGGERSSTQLYCLNDRVSATFPLRPRHSVKGSLSFRYEEQPVRDAFLHTVQVSIGTDARAHTDLDVPLIPAGTP